MHFCRRYTVSKYAIYFLPEDEGQYYNVLTLKSCSAWLRQKYMFGSCILTMCERWKLITSVQPFTLARKDVSLRLRSDVLSFSLFLFFVYSFLLAILWAKLQRSSRGWRHCSGGGLCITGTGLSGLVVFNGQSSTTSTGWDLSGSTWSSSGISG
jgi:hypothetical protein